MLGAIYIGLSGMQTFSKGLQIISNNVANMNTLGFKGTSVTFADSFNRGGLGSFHSGRNGQSFGSGVQLGSRTINFIEGDIRQTGGALDLAIKGDGFLVLSGENGKTYYGRTGQFDLDNKGYVSLLGSSYRLNLLDASGAASPVNIDDRRTSPPVATGLIKFDRFLTTDSSFNKAVIPDIAVYDSVGVRHVWKVTMDRAIDETPPMPRKWSVTVTDESGAEVGKQSITFDPAGDPDPTSFTLAYSPTGSAPMSVKLDFSGVDHIGAGTTSTIRVASSDGRGSGNLSKVTVTENGTLLLTYSNNQTIDLGAVAIADFRDLQKLEQVGSGLFRNNGSEVRLLASEKDGAGTLVSGQVEASNVDLSQQFGDLILIQRGFQASSQVLSVSNDMIQQLFGIRGQG